MTSHAIVEKIVASAQAQRKKLAVFLDIDGTLIDIADTPDSVVVPDSLEGSLTGLSESLGGALAIVTGRDVEFIDASFPHLNPASSAEHGTLYRAAPGAEFQHMFPQVDVSSCDQKLHALADRVPGARVEHKATSRVLHWREAEMLDEECRAIFGDAVKAIVQEQNKGVATEDRMIGHAFGKMVLEILPKNANKGRAIDQFMGLPNFRGRVPVYLGDAEPDIPAIMAVKKFGGIAIAVGSDVAEHADYMIESPAVVRNSFLPALQSSVTEYNSSFAKSPVLRLGLP